MIQRPCPICGFRKTSRVEAVENKRDMGGSPLRIASCASCGGVFQPVIFDNAALAEWYDYMGRESSNVKMTALLRRRLERTVKSFEHHRVTNRLLEVGCGGGLFVQAAVECGWEVYGTELSPSCCAVLRPLLGSQLYQGDLREAPFERASFDVVVMMELIEHLPDPAPYLVATHRLLRPGGCLVLTTPNLSGVSGRVWGRKWRVMNDEHLNYFDRRTIRRLLVDHGYNDVTVGTSGFDVGVYAKVLKSTLSRLRWRPSPAATVNYVEQKPVSGSENQFVVSVVDFAMEVANPILSLFSLGDVLKVRARKPSSLS